MIEPKVLVNIGLYKNEDEVIVDGIQVDAERARKVW